MSSRRFSVIMVAMRHVRLILIAILITAFFLRFYQISSLPPGPEWDEASVGYNAYAVATTGSDEWGHTLPHIFEAFGDYKNPLYIYATSLFVKLFGLSLFSVRLTAVLAGTLAIVLVYGIAWELFRRKGPALLAAFFLAVSPPAIFFSRIAGDGMIFSACLILAGIYFELKFLRSRDLKYALLSHVFLITSLFAYNLARVLSPLFILLFTGMNLRGSFKRKISYLVIVLITVLCTGFILLSQAKAGGASRISYVGIFGSDKSAVLEVNRLREDEKNSFRSRLLFNKATLYGITLLNNYVEHFGGDFLTSYHNQSVVFESFYPLLSLVSLPFYYLGLFLAFRTLKETKDKNEKLMFIILFLWIFLSPLPSAVTEGAPSGKRYLGSLGSHEIMVAYALFAVYERYKAWFARKFRRGVRYAFFAFLFLPIGIYLFDFYAQYARTHQTLYAAKENTVGLWIAKQYPNYDFFIYSHQLTGFPYIYPVFHMRYPFEEFWKDRRFYKLDGWNYVSRVGKMEFPDRLNFEVLTGERFRNKKIALFLNVQEYEEFKKTSWFRKLPEQRIYDDGGSIVYLIPLKL